jgi:hypothetical protein
VEPPEVYVRPAWQRTDDPYFPTVARVDGSWWVLRINSFPDHALYTFFVDGTVRFDLDDVPAAWGRPADETLPLLSDAEVDEALAPVRDYVAYGSEVGQPCTNPYCCG